MDALHLAKWGVTGLKTGLTVYKGRKEIQGLWARILAPFRDPVRRIGFTGMPGVGKTVLYDHLRGAGFAQDYHPPRGSSVGAERDTVVQPGQRLVLTVVPGQDSPARHSTLDELQADGVEGLVHVVANGYARVFGDAARVLDQQGVHTVEDFRHRQLAEELKDLDATCETVRKMCRRHRRPRWMIVAVSQIDLYPNDTDTAYGYYGPNGDGAFAQRLRELARQVGTDNFGWTAVPVFSWPEDFRWSDEFVLSDKDLETRSQLVANLALEIEQRCAGG